MKNKILFLKFGKGTCALAVALAGALTASVAQADDVHASVNITVPPIVAPNTFAVQDDYAYYPAYHVYYSKHHHQYAWLKNNSWVTGATPPDVSVDVLRRAPSVDMDFHDSPAKHHADVLRKYPKDWAPRHSDR
jgi:hypothetical protein